MRLNDIKDILEAKVITGEEFLGKEINSAYGSDLMSDVLTFVKPGSMLITGLINSQVVRTAEIADISAICFVCDKEPQIETIQLAKKNKIPLLATKFSMYESCGLLFKEGVSSCLTSDVK